MQADIGAPKSKTTALAGDSTRCHKVTIKAAVGDGRQRDSQAARRRRCTRNGSRKRSGESLQGFRRSARDMIDADCGRDGIGHRELTIKRSRKWPPRSSPSCSALDFTHGLVLHRPSGKRATSPPRGDTPRSSPAGVQVADKSDAFAVTVTLAVS